MGPWAPTDADEGAGNVDGPPLSLWTWAAAAAPVALLFALVATGRVRSQVAAALVLGATVVIAATVFRADLPSALVALGKGLWLGLWILLVVWPALLLYRIAAAAGLSDIGETFGAVLPDRTDRLLVLAWIFPAFIQGVAGFGTPIAVAAPLLAAMGWSPIRAVLYPLVGYHWAVTFGSMGSSFYMASLTAGLEGGPQREFAVTAAGMLAGQCLIAGAAVLLLDGGRRGLRSGRRTLLLVGIPMALTLVATAAAVPAVASLAAAAVGLAVVAARAVRWRRGGGQRPGAAGGAGGAGRSHRSAAVDVRGAVALVSPYLWLLATALPVFIVPASRSWVGDNLVVAPSFPATGTGWGWTASAVEAYTPVQLLGHPGFYILLAAGLGLVTYRSAGLWRRVSGRAVARRWAGSLPAASLPVLLLASVATVLIDSGMVAILADGVGTVAGRAYPPVAPWVGALGAFLTGSTTTSNALFAAFQQNIAGLLDVAPTVLLAAQTAGGNVGNIVAPVVVLVGLSAMERTDEVAPVVRRGLPVAVAVLLWLSLLTGVLAWWG